MHQLSANPSECSSLNECVIKLLENVDHCNSSFYYKTTDSTLINNGFFFTPLLLPMKVGRHQLFVYVIKIALKTTALTIRRFNIIQSNKLESAMRNKYLKLFCVWFDLLRQSFQMKSNKCLIKIMLRTLNIARICVAFHFQVVLSWTQLQTLSFGHIHISYICI